MDLFGKADALIKVVKCVTSVMHCEQPTGSSTGSDKVIKSSQLMLTQLTTQPRQMSTSIRYRLNNNDVSEKQLKTNHSKRQTLTILATGAISALLPWRTSTAKDSDLANKQSIIALDDTGREIPIDTTISTLGIGSAVITLNNRSNKTVRLSKLHPQMVEHDGIRYDINTALGNLGVRLEPGSRRILAPQQLPFLSA